MDKENKISLDSIVIQNKDLDATDMDGDLVMMDMLKGRYYSMNSVGSRIWTLIAVEHSVKDLISILLNEFDVDDKTCTDTVLDFLNGIYNEDLISIA